MQPLCSGPSQVPCYGKYYVYSSSPALSHADRPRKPKPVLKKSGSCLANHAGNIRTRGAHEFYNMMWDPSVYRGNTNKPFYVPEMERCNKKRREMESVKRRKFPRKPKLIGGIVRPSLSPADQTDKIGLGDMGMQTEEFLQEMTSDVAKKDMCTQVEEDVNERRDEGGYILAPFNIGTCQACQTNPSLQFEEMVRPIRKQLSRKIIEQSLLETTEELELEAIRKEKRKYIQMRADKLYELKRLVEAQRAVAEDRMREMNARESEAKAEKEAETRLSAALFAAQCMGGMMPITFGLLKLEGYMTENGTDEIYQRLLPWMDEAIKKSYQNRILSRNLLDEILHNVTTERETQIASNQFSDSLMPQSESKSHSLNVEEKHEEHLSLDADYHGKLLQFYETGNFGEGGE